MILVQGVSLISGFVLVRSMEKEHYAWFTIFNSLLAMISILTDSGLGSAVMSLGGEHFEDKRRFASLMLTAQRLRSRFMALAVPPVLLGGWWMLVRNSAPPWLVAGLLLMVLLTSIAAAENAVLGAVNKLERHVGRILLADVCLNLSRLGAVLLGLLTGLNSLVAGVATTLSQWAQTLLLRHQTRASLAVGEISEVEWKEPMMKVVRQTFPLCLFQAFQGHLTTWVLSIFAVTTDVANVGALSRLGIVFAMFSLPLVQLLCPVIARTSNPVRLTKLCWLAVGGFTVAACSLAALGVVFADQVLWVLGDGYRHLKDELAWYLGAQTLGVVTTTIWAVVFTRSWVRSAWFQLPITLLVQVIVLSVLNLKDVRHAIVFGSIYQLVGGIAGVALIVRGLREHAARSAFKS